MSASSKLLTFLNLIRFFKMCEIIVLFIFWISSVVGSIPNGQVPNSIPNSQVPNGVPNDPVPNVGGTNGDNGGLGSYSGGAASGSNYGDGGGAAASGSNYGDWNFFGMTHGSGAPRLPPPSTTSVLSAPFVTLFLYFIINYGCSILPL